MTPDLVFLHSSGTPQCRSIVDKHFEGYWTLQYATEGAIELFYEDECHELRAGENTCWFWPAYPGPRIRFHLARDARYWNHRYCAFTGPRVSHWKNAGLWLAAPQEAPRGPDHTAVFDEMIGHIHRPGDWARRRATHLLEGILLELAEARSVAGSDEAWLSRARRFFEQSREFAPNYDELARELGMGISTLRRKFKAATGLSLHEAYMQQRLDSARRLLIETNLPLKAIATQLGYRDVYFFSNQFKQLSGVTPAAYRRSRQE
jgi:AraC-like DNA-binding protein